jgi:hypothetical protein
MNDLGRRQIEVVLPGDEGKTRAGPAPAAGLAALR